ncbi:hypothetical protein MTO96_009482 [Rhipicephalus appendiculatus]
MKDLRFLYFILYLCTASNVFFAGSSAMGAHSKTNKEGIIFDIIYGLGSVLNLVSDVVMIQALRKASEAKVKFRLFLMWNTFTTGAYYVTDLFLSDFNSKHIKLEKEHLQDMDEESARHTIFFASVLISTVVFLAKMYRNYDQVVANEEARIHGTQRALLANEPAVGYLFRPVSPLGVPAIAAGPAFLRATSTSGFQMATPSWSGVPSSTHEAKGQPYYVAIQQPRSPGQQLAPTQPQLNPPGEIAYVQYYTGVRPQLTMVDQSVIVPSPTAVATTAGSASVGSPPDKWTTPDAPSYPSGLKSRCASQDKPSRDHALRRSGSWRLAVVRSDSSFTDFEGS